MKDFCIALRFSVSSHSTSLLASDVQSVGCIDRIRADCSGILLRGSKLNIFKHFIP